MIGNETLSVLTMCLGLVTRLLLCLHGKMMTRFIGLMVLALGVSAAPLHALTVTNDPATGGTGPTAVLTVAKGNDIKAGQVNSDLLGFINSFKDPDFTVIRADDMFKVDYPNTAAGFTFTALDSAKKGESRHFSWSTLTAYEFVVFKAGPGFVAHYYEGGTHGGAVIMDKGISHLSFVVPAGPSIVTPPPVPLPASGLLLLAALGVGSIGLRRRKTA
ncbi:hypothetical protein ACN2XU_21315 [Primorskyibacter sp. 2E107]|uniref:hypothetical protein n=1 Tax=Primorskyibacter sp. 2E107 TaxID=3403458 RepID=UPI003AF897C6